MWEKNGLVKRSTQNPILTPIEDHWWESRLVYNTGAVQLGGRIYLLYRAMGEDHVARFGLAFSADGINFTRLVYPVFFPETEYETPHSSKINHNRERGGVEDPRLMVVGDTIYVIYTAFHKMCHLAMTKISIAKFLNMVDESEKFLEKDLSMEWNSTWKRVGLLFPHLFEVPEMFSRNSVMLQLQKGLHILFYRIHKGDILVSLSSNPEGPWKDKSIPFLTKQLPWEMERIGISTPAIPVSDNGMRKFLLFYHGVEERKTERNLIKVYHLGALFLSAKIEDKNVILKTERLKHPVLSPERDYELENEWLLSVGVNAVFSCGAVPVGKDTIYIYYGSGDTNISLGRAFISELLQQEKITEICEIDRTLF